MTWRAISAWLWTRGNCAARVHLAWCYSHGKGVGKIDHTESFWLLMAARAQVDDEGHIAAYWHFGERIADLICKALADRENGENTEECLMEMLEYVAGGLLRTITRPTLNLCPLVRLCTGARPGASIYTRKRPSFSAYHSPSDWSMSIQPRRKSCCNRHSSACSQWISCPFTLKVSRDLISVLCLFTMPLIHGAQGQRARHQSNHRVQQRSSDAG
jgi:TPR repeat protein